MDEKMNWGFIILIFLFFMIFGGWGNGGLFGGRGGECAGCGVGAIAPRLLTACFIDSGGCPNAVKTLATFGLSNVAKAFVKDSVPPFSLTAFIKPSLELP